ncbi:carotenoid oxygenase family protein [Leptolyngbya sp. AN03gr2]|uniref:carotenoid oxygenase family protein n=1 Tax=unclassified Leptolyngbya TaxID=2650499 RepID=UPI003D3146E9
MSGKIRTVIPMESHHIPSSVVKVSRCEIDDLCLTVQAFEIHPNSQLAAVEGDADLPENLAGYYFVVSALAQPSTSVFNGDGMIYRLEFRDRKATLKTRIAKPPCYYLDQAIQRHPDQYPKAYAFQTSGLNRMSRKLGSRNQLNTAFLQTRDRLVLTFDAGIPWVIDPDSMELIEPVGRMDEWLSVTSPFEGLIPMLSEEILPPYSNPAHPVCDQFKPEHDFLNCPNSPAEFQPDHFLTLNYSTGYKGKFRKNFDRTIGWIRRKTARSLNIGRGKNTPCTDRIYGFTDLVRYTFEDHQLERWQLVLPDWDKNNPDDEKLVIGEQSIHQMAITEDYIILMDIAFKIEFSQIFAPYSVGLFDPLLDRLFKSLVQIGKTLFSKQQQANLLKQRLDLGYRLYAFFLKLLPAAQITNCYIVSRAELRKCCNNPGGSLAEPPKSLQARKVTIPREVSHFTADYHNPDGKITLHIGHQNGTDVTEWISKYDKPVEGHEMQFGQEQSQRLAGMSTGAMDVSSFGRYVIDGETGALLDSKVFSDVEHTWWPSVYTHRDLCRERATEPATEVKNIYWMCWGFSWELVPDRIYQAYKEREFRVVHHTQLPKESKPCKLLRLDTQTMEIVDWFDFPPGHFACSPQFIPKSTPCPPHQDPSTHGYLACVVLSDTSDAQPQDEFWIFDANNLGHRKYDDLGHLISESSCLHNKAVVYKLSHSHTLNLSTTIHSTWLSFNDFLHKSSLYSTPQKRRDLRRAAFWQDFGAFVDPNSKTTDMTKNPRAFKVLDETTKSLFQQIQAEFIAQILEAKLSSTISE